MFNFLSGGRARTSNRIRAQRARNATKQHLRLESLENRTLLSGNVTALFHAATSELVIKGDTNNNAIVITQNSDGTVTVAGVNTSINNAGTPVTTPTGANVESIDVYLNNGNEAVSLNGFTPLGGPAPTIQIPKIDLELGTGRDNVVVNEVLANKVTINAKASSSPGGDLGKFFDTVTVENSNIATLKVTLDNAPGDLVTLANNLNLGDVTVYEGNGIGDDIEVTNNVELGTVKLTQNDGPAITVGVPIFLIDQPTLVGFATVRIPQNDVINVDNNAIAHALTIKQGDGDNDYVYVNDISGVPSSTGTQYAAITITQGGGQHDYVEVAFSDNDSITASSVAAQSLTITQGLGKLDEVYVGSSDAATLDGGDGNLYAVLLFGKPVEVENFPGPSQFIFSGGDLKIKQGDGESDSVSVTNLEARDAKITQGNGNSDIVTFEDSLLHRNLTITVGDGNDATVSVADESPVQVNGETVIKVSGFENTITLGGDSELLPDGEALETDSLTVFAGYGSITVIADNVTVDNDQGTITAEGDGNTFVDSGGNFGFEVHGFSL